MKSINSVLNAYRLYRKFTKTNKIYKAVYYSLLSIFTVYGLILIFPQFLFANKISHRNFNVYANQELDENMIRVLDSTEARLLKSPVYDKNIKENLFIADSHALYKFLTLSTYSLGSTIPVIGHSRINKSDIENDTVYRNTSEPNKRSLSGVVAHETMHNQIRERFGFTAYMQIPRWKDEGYCEYVAGETTLSFEAGVRLWKENPNDTSKYDYFRYHQMVKYLLDDEKISVEDLFNRQFDEKELTAKVFVKISKYN